MSKKITYSDCKTSGLGLCWFCNSKTNYILDNLKEEIFCCFFCAVKHNKSAKLRRKVRNLEQMLRKSKISENSKILQGKKGQNAIYMGGSK